MDENIVRSGSQAWVPRLNAGPAAASTARARARSRSNCCCNASTEANRFTSRSRSTHSIRTHSPYRSPSKSKRCASRLPPPVLKGGLGALVHHPPGAAAAPLDPHRVHAVGRQQLLRRHVGQVDRRDADQPAPPLAVAHAPAHLVRPAQHAGRGGEVAAGDGPADPRAGDVLLADVHRVTTSTSKPALGAEAAEGLDVAAPPAAEAVIVPDHQLAHPAAVEQHLAARTPRA